MTQEVTVTLKDSDAKRLRRHVEDRKDLLGQLQQDWLGEETAELSTNNEVETAEAVAWSIKRVLKESDK